MNRYRFKLQKVLDVKNIYRELRRKEFRDAMLKLQEEEGTKRRLQREVTKYRNDMKSLRGQRLLSKKACPSSRFVHTGLHISQTLPSFFPLDLLHQFPHPLLFNKNVFFIIIIAAQIT